MVRKGVYSASEVFISSGLMSCVALAGMSGEDTEAIMYFDFLLPRLKEAYPDVGILVGYARF